MYIDKSKVCKVIWYKSGISEDWLWVPERPNKWYNTGYLPAGYVNTWSYKWDGNDAVRYSKEEINSRQSLFIKDDIVWKKAEVHIWFSTSEPLTKLYFNTDSEAELLVEELMKSMQAPIKL